MQHREERHQLPGDVRGGSGRRQELAPQQRDAVRGGGAVAAGGEVQRPRPRHQLGDGEEPASDDSGAAHATSSKPMTSNSDKSCSFRINETPCELYKKVRTSFIQHL